MPVIPRPVTLSATSTDILNAIRKENGPFYSSIVPLADGTTESLRKIGTAILNNQGVQNAFLTTLINRIGQVIISSRLYESPLARFKRGVLEYGEAVEEIFVNISKAHSYNPEKAETEWMKREIPDVRTEFHTLNYQKFYKQTISDVELKLAFLSESGFTDLVQKIIEAMYTSANFDEFLMMKYIIAREIVNGTIKAITLDTVDSENADNIMRSIKGVSNAFTTMSTQYNRAGVYNYSDKSWQYLISTAEFNAFTDVDVLAKAFNMDKAEFAGNNIMIDSFTFTAEDLDRITALLEDMPDGFVAFTEEELAILESVQAVLIDYNYLMIFDNLITMRTVENGEGLYRNYWLHIWKIYSTSPFANAVLFTTDVSSITSVTVTPTTATINKGSSSMFSATVTGTGIYNKYVNWSVTGDSALSTNTHISHEGILTIGSDETNTSLTVTATSSEDNSKTATATVTVG